MRRALHKTNLRGGGCFQRLWTSNLYYLMKAATHPRVFDSSILVHADLSDRRQSLRRVSTLEFDEAVFGRGPPILHDADQRFAKTFG